MSIEARLRALEKLQSAIADDSSVGWFLVHFDCDEFTKPQCRPWVEGEATACLAHDGKLPPRFLELSKGKPVVYLPATIPAKLLDEDGFTFFEVGTVADWRRWTRNDKVQPRFRDDVTSVPVVESCQTSL